MSGLDLNQLRLYVVIPALQAIGLHCLASERLVLATGLVESRYRYIDQIERGGNKVSGPARGLWQMESATHNDIWDNYLKHNADLMAKVRTLMIEGLNPVEQLQGNLYYAAAMCRIHYRRVKWPLPKADNLEGMATYWKRYYNTSLGAGTVDGFIQTASPIMQH